MIEINKSLTAKNIAKGPRKVVGIILHDTAGSGTHNDTKYLANPGDGRKVSVDFTVERDGSIWQLNPDLGNGWTYHAGRATSFKGLHNAQVTKGCIGIEIVQKARIQDMSPTYTEAQVKSVAELCAFLCDAFNLSKSDITTHQKVITDGSRSDPRLFPWASFWGYFANATLESANAHAIFHIVVKGDTLWGIANKYNTTIEDIKSLNAMETASTLIEVGQKIQVTR